MSLRTRLQTLATRRPPPPRTPVLPEDPVTWARGFVSGAWTIADIDPTHPDHLGWLARVMAFVTTLTPQHQQWLRQQRELTPGCYPDALLLPATNDEILAALDAVMRWG